MWHSSGSVHAPVIHLCRVLRLVEWNLSLILLRWVWDFFRSILFLLISWAEASSLSWIYFNNFGFFLLFWASFLSAAANSWLGEVGTLYWSVHINGRPSYDYGQVEDCRALKEVFNHITVCKAFFRAHPQVLHWQEQVCSQKTDKLIKPRQDVKLSFLERLNLYYVAEREEVESDEELQLQPLSL